MRYTHEAMLVYSAFVVWQAALATLLPGPIIEGLPVPSENFRKLQYNCNGVTCWYVTLATAAALHCTQVFDLTWFINHFRELLMASFVWGFAVTLITYAVSVHNGTAMRMTGNVLYGSMT